MSLEEKYKKYKEDSEKKNPFKKRPTHEGEDKAVYDVREAKSNSYHDTNMKLIKDLKRDA